MSEERTVERTIEVFCKSCGKSIKKETEICPSCGVRQQTIRSEKSKTTLLLLCIFLPFIHRFYVGKVVTGILFAITLGGFGLWWLIDFIMIICGNFTDSEGKKVTK